jgi:YD repeat-containing protein
MDRGKKLWQGDVSTARDLTTSFQYDAASNLVKAIDPLNRQLTSEFDSAERLTASTDPIGNRTELVLDKTGNPATHRSIEVQSSGGSVTVTTTSTFDALGRVATTQDDLANVQKLFYDARNNLQSSVDPENFVTTRTYDGFDRLVREVKPEGISVDYGYDRSSHLLSYKDALGQETTYTYDALNRRTGVEYPDHTHETYAYDANNNPQQVSDANGNVITQTFDSGNRLTGRAVARGSGVIGPNTETYAYDGLGRMTQATSGSITTQMTFDSLSRLVHERTANRDFDFNLDDVGNPTRIQYPSGFALSQTFDPLNRPSAIDWAANTSSSYSHPVSYGYRGTGLITSKTLSNGLTGTRQYDAVRRLLDETFQTETSQSVFHESLAWTPRSLKAAQTRHDLNGEGMLFAYDGASRLTQATKTANPTLANNSVAAPGDFTKLADAFAYAYDPAQNLLSTTKKENGIPDAVALPLDGSKRNRPGAVGSEALTWDANGNLLSKGDLRFQYDYRNRLTRVSQANGDEVATYEYDTFNRRLKKTVGTDTVETAWRGWQPVEEYRNSQLDQRRVYGLGLDEVVQVQTGFNGGSQPGESYQRGCPEPTGLRGCAADPERPAGPPADRDHSDRRAGGRHSRPPHSSGGRAQGPFPQQAGSALRAHLHLARRRCRPRRRPADQARPRQRRPGRPSDRLDGRARPHDGQRNPGRRRPRRLDLERGPLHADRPLRDRRRLAHVDDRHRSERPQRHGFDDSLHPGVHPGQAGRQPRRLRSPRSAGDLVLHDRKPL